jgi:Transposase DDE domain
MSFYSSNSTKPDFALLSRSFAFRSRATFTGLLEPSFFQDLADKHDLHFGQGEGDTFNPAVTTWAWLSQALSPAKSCVAATARVLVLCCSLSLPLCSGNAGAFCKARRKLSAEFFRDAAVQLGQKIEQRALDSWRWKGRTVKIVDGSLFQLPDTEDNLQEYPQQRSQKKGTSYTSMRVVVLLAFATGGLLDAASGAYRGKKTGEMSLFRSLWHQVHPGDVFVGDRIYANYQTLAELPLRHADGVFRLSVQRQKGFGTGERLGRDDWLQTWERPKRPKAVTAEEWQKLPEQIRVRVLRVRVEKPGWRTKELYLVTTLLDPVAYPAADIAALYLKRWSGEVDLRSIKQTLGMKLLSCKTPEMVQAELWAHFLGYNLTRCVMAQAAQDKGRKPRQLSFAGAVQTLDAFRWLLTCSDKDPGMVACVLSTALATHRVGNRPDRSEPREIKHRQRKYPELCKSRQERREELKAGQTEKRDSGRGKNRPNGRMH